MSMSKNNEQNESEIKKFKVYAHVNRYNGKTYIGQTSKSPNQRWDNGKGYSYNTHFYRAIQKYGWDNFEHIVLMENLTKEMANIIEKELIQKYNSTDQRFGYNFLLGGNNGYESYNPNYVRTISDETRKKMSRSQIARFDRVGRKKKIKPPPKPHPNIHKIYRLDKDLNILYTYLSKQELCKKLNKKSVCMFFPNKPYCVYDKYIYVYAELYEYVIHNKDLLRDINRKLDGIYTTAKKVICLNDLSIYDSILQASIKKEISASNITFCCQGKGTYGGIDPILGKLMWEYYDENKIYKKKEYDCYKKCFCITTNELFDSALKASEKYGIDVQNIQRACRKQGNTLGGNTEHLKLTWKYLEDIRNEVLI